MGHHKKLEKTSVQLPPDVFRDMNAWPGLTRSQAIRLSVERAHYISTLNSEGISSIADHYGPILQQALEDFDYSDYRAAGRALPAIVEGFVRENPNVTWRYEGADRGVLDPTVLIEKLNAMDAVERIGILDCVVAQRNLALNPTPESSPKSRRKKPSRASTG